MGELVHISEAVGVVIRRAQQLAELRVLAEQRGYNPDWVVDELLRVERETGRSWDELYQRARVFYATPAEQRPAAALTSPELEAWATRMRVAYAYVGAWLREAQAAFLRGLVPQRQPQRPWKLPHARLSKARRRAR